MTVHFKIVGILTDTGAILEIEHTTVGISHLEVGRLGRT